MKFRKVLKARCRVCGSGKYNWFTSQEFWPGGEKYTSTMRVMPVPFTTFIHASGDPQPFKNFEFSDRRYAICDDLLNQDYSVVEARVAEWAQLSLTAWVEKLQKELIENGGYAFNVGPEKTTFYPLNNFGEVVTKEIYVDDLLKLKGPLS